MKSPLMTVLRYVVTVLLVLLVCYKAGLFTAAGRAEILAIMASANLTFLLLSILIQFLLNFSSALKWWMLLLARGVRIHLGRIWAYYMICQLYNLILPTSMGGDVVRMFELGRYTRRHAEAVASVFVERFTGLVTMVVFALVVYLSNLTLLDHPLITFSVVAFTAGILLLWWLIFDQRPFNVARWLSEKFGRSLMGLVEKIGKFIDAIRTYLRDGKAIGVAFVNSLVFYGLAILNVWITARIFNPDATLLHALVATPVILLVCNLPISIGQIGLMEFAYTLTFDIVGLGSAVGLSTALVMRIKVFLDAGIGAICHPLIARGRSIPDEIRSFQSQEQTSGDDTSTGAG